MPAIRLIYSDARVEYLDRDTPDCASFAVGLQTDGQESRHGRVYTLTVVPKKPDLSLRTVEVETDLPASLFSDEDALFCYDNASFTNDVSGIRSYRDCPTRTFSELALFFNKTSGDLWLCGFVTSHVFWSYIRLENRKIVFTFDLEDRPLEVGKPYVMERFMIAGDCEKENGELPRSASLLRAYARAVAAYNDTAKLVKNPLPVGFCSWSRYYHNVNEAKIKAATDALVKYCPAGQANLVQIDDGWQRQASFPGVWETDCDKFPSGMRALSDYVTSRGMTFGLWLAPLLISEKSSHYAQMSGYIMPDVTLENDIHPFELDNPVFLEHLSQTFRQMREEHGAAYFKIDFIAAAIRYFTGEANGSHVRFKTGFCIEVLRRALNVIREAVGDDCYLLSCGAPLLVSAGIFNGARMSCDIIWGKNPAFPTYWQIIKNCQFTIGVRGFYHRTVFINDGDGVVLRDVDIGDGFDASWSEAQLWASTVAMSGGAYLNNEELENLSPSRRALFTGMLPPLDVPAYPIDMFESPSPSSYYAPVTQDSGTAFLWLYNKEDTMRDMSFDLGRVGMSGALVVDCFTHTPICIGQDRFDVKNVNPHGCGMYLLKKTGDKPAFAYSDINTWQGVRQFTDRFVGDCLTVTPNPDTDTRNCRVFAIWPPAYKPDGKTVWSQDGYTVTEIQTFID